MSENVLDVTDQNFEEEVLNSEKPVLVDFWAAWCAPCRTLAPTVDQIAQEFSDQAKVVKLNVDDNAEISAKYNIKGIPTLLLFKGGEIKDQIVGAASKDNIARMIQAQL
jgi:thioredoxin 1